MSIHWYPGHMHKAQKEIKQLLPQVDLLIEVLDARIPYSSENPAIAKIRGDKPCIKILNKTDLADPDATLAWQAYLEQQKNVKTFTTSIEEPGKIKQLLDLCRKMLPEKDAGIKTINAMICGIPNVGKSTLINHLAGRIIAKTGNEPAVTKAQQRINLGSGIVLFDTPGILWPKVENANSSYRLAVTGAIKNTAAEFDDMGFFAADYLIKAYPDLLKQRFKLDDIPDTEIEFLELAAKSRGAIMAGGRVNLHKICEVLINEFRLGKIGRITLESPDMVEQEEAEMERQAAVKASKDAERKQRFKDGSLTPDKKDAKQIRIEKRNERSAQRKRQNRK
ncbi:ribosome biogenesis GTPase YlqF [Neptunicella sp. SCSIO 80796]|uniref:ribosome biogenesis GTPase YlqF n=1 Tax=Neptunicella plasticusilytica TaxID=3117012 RepID=UPI003A4D90DC